MKTNIISFILLTLALTTACTSTPPVDIQGTAAALVVTEVHLTQSALPTSTSTMTATIETILSTPYPTQPPPPIFTPDAIQVERWKEYQTELIKVVLSGYDSALYEYALCEWDILGRSPQEVYVWAYCATPGGGSGSFPTAIYLEADGAIRNVRVAGYKGPFFDLELFPADVQEKCGLYTGDSRFNGRVNEMKNHLHYRREHPEEPPLIVLSATPMP